jgi:hypothetical protein
MFSPRQPEQSHSAQVPIRQTIHYRWHPLHGRSVRVRRAVARADGDYVFCELPDATICGLPKWMMDAGECARHSEGPALVSADALASLATVLHSILSGAEGDSRPGKEATDGRQARTKRAASANSAGTRSGDPARSQTSIDRRTGRSARTGRGKRGQANAGRKP